MRWIGTFLISLLVFGESTVNAGIIINSVDFTPIANRDSLNIAVHLSADVVGDTGDLSKALFIIRLHDDLVADTHPQINNVFFEDGALGSIAGLGDADDLLSFAGYVEDTHVDFSDGHQLLNLPGFKKATPEYEAAFRVVADKPHQSLTVLDEGESLGVLFNLGTGKTYLDLINDMADGETRIGVKVTSTGEGSYVSDPMEIVDIGRVAAVPEPISLISWGGGMLCLALGRRMFGRKAAKSESKRA